MRRDGVPASKPTAIADAARSTTADIGGGPIATAESEAMRAGSLARLVMRRQATAIWPLLSLDVLQIHVYSAGFLFDRRLRNAGCEAGLLLAHAVAYLGGLILLLGVGRGLLEHHLFPTMPRCNLRAAAPIVHRFCRDRGIVYHETGVLEAFGEVRRHLASVIVPLRRPAAPAGIKV